MSSGEIQRNDPSCTGMSIRQWGRNTSRLGHADVKPINTRQCFDEIFKVMHHVQSCSGLIRILNKVNGAPCRWQRSSCLDCVMGSWYSMLSFLFQSWNSEFYNTLFSALLLNNYFNSNFFTLFVLYFSLNRVEITVLTSFYLRQQIMHDTYYVFYTYQN